ncbi:MAG TPA: sigma-70 family RNA polymerase sigma factor [Anaerolineales bacterium]
MAILGIELEKILSRARRMDRNALAEIHDLFYPEVYRYVRYRLDNEQVCEDIASEVFLRLLSALHQRRGPNQNLRGWLLGTASNLVNDHLRRRYSGPLEDLLNQEDHPDQNPSPEHAAEDHWQLDAVRKALRQLTPEQQNVLALRFADERSLEETARIIGKSVNAVKALQFRALASLKRYLTRGERG